MDIGVVLDLMIHDLEIVLHLVNSPIATIDAVGIPVSDTPLRILRTREFALRTGASPISQRAGSVPNG